MKGSALVIVAALAALGTAACSGGGGEAAPTALPTLAAAEATSAPVAAPTEASVEEPAGGEGEAAGALALALEAAQAEDWDKTRSQLTEASDLAADPQEKQSVEEILADLEQGEYEEVVEDLEMLVASGETGMSMLESHLEKALGAARDADWEKAGDLLEEAADLATDPLEKQAIEEIIADLEKDDYDEVLEDLEKMVGGGTGESSVDGYLKEALDAGQAGDWDKAGNELEEALDAATDPQEKQAIEEIIADLEKGDYDEVLEDLEKLIE